MDEAQVYRPRITGPCRWHTGDHMKRENPSAATIDQYLAGFPEEVQRILSELRETIRKAAPAATEKISYQIPTFYLNGNLVHFAAFPHHVGFYPTPGGIEAFEEQLRKYKTAKGSVQFPIDEPLPLQLIADIVRFRVAENTRGSREAAAPEMPGAPAGPDPG